MQRRFVSADKMLLYCNWQLIGYISVKHEIDHVFILQQKGDTTHFDVQGPRGVVGRQHVDPEKKNAKCVINGLQAAFNK